MAQTIDIKSFYEGLDRMYGQHDYGETEKYLLGSLKTAQEEMNISLIIAVSNELGGFYRAAGKVDEAKLLNDSVLKALESIGQDRNENYATALMNAANSHNSAHEYDVALGMYKKAEDLLEQLGLGKDYRMAALCNNISSLYRENGDLEEAEKMARKSILIISEIPDARLDMATSLINLEEVQTRLGKYREAEESLKTAAAIYEHDAGGMDIHYASAVAAMGALEYYRGNFEASAERYRKALELIRRDFGKSAYYTMIENNLKMVEAEMRK